ncbi:unnamed protein product [Staurois parvus]|uniref:C2H2-type domain-containing protein n=1 Tax=Staurois parvus TaxID=386267 RepID=A0ABN9AP07_9NEOB|nr:unnamed protein product [Staurois parvus]
MSHREGQFLQKSEISYWGEIFLFQVREMFFTQVLFLYILVIIQGGAVIPLPGVQEMFFKEVQPYACPECGKYFSAKTSLYTHLARRRSCTPVQIAGNVLRRSPFLYIRQRFHTVEKPYRGQEGE